MFPDPRGGGGSRDADSAAIAPRKRGLNILEVLSGMPESFLEAPRFEWARKRDRAEWRPFRRNQGIIGGSEKFLG